jgi:hypothetical protein
MKSKIMLVGLIVVIAIIALHVAVPSTFIDRIYCKQLGICVLNKVTAADINATKTLIMNNLSIYENSTTIILDTGGKDLCLGNCTG